MPWSGGGAMNYQLQPNLKKARNTSLVWNLMGQNELRAGYRRARKAQEPYYDQGIKQLNAFNEWNQGTETPIERFEGTPGNIATYDITQDPSYQWRLSQGLEAVENSAAAIGGQLSGNALKAINDYAQGAASTEYAAAHNRYSDEYNREYQRWLAQLGMGQNAANNMSNLRAQGATAISNLMAGAGQNYFNNTLSSADQIRQAEVDFNNVLQSWVPAMYGGGSPTGASQPGNTGSASQYAANYTGMSGKDFTGGASDYAAQWKPNF